jgi:hypothetical protein
MATLTDGRVLVTGGLTPQGAGPITVATAATEIFDPATGAFAAGPDLTTPRFNHSAVTLADGRVLVLGGNGLRSAELFTPSTNTFTAVGDMAVSHGNGHVALLLPNGKVLVLGGNTTTSGQPTAVAELFDPITRSFAPAGNMTSARALHFAVLQEDGTVLIGGGLTEAGDALESAEQYDPIANTFTRIADMPGTSYDQAAAIIRNPRPGR